MRRRRKTNKAGLIITIIGIVAVAVIAVILIINFKKGKTGDEIAAQKELQEEQFNKDVIPYGDNESDTYDFSGDYFDTATQKGTMTIVKDGNAYTISITYAESDDAISMWKMTAAYDKYRKALSYRDGTRADYIMASSEEDSERNEVYTGGSGLIYLSSGSFYWVDDKEDMGAGLLFKKVEDIAAEGQGSSGSSGSGSTGETTAPAETEETEEAEETTEETPSETTETTETGETQTETEGTESATE